MIPVSSIVHATDIAWAAGMIDGEGCIHIARVKRASGHRVNYRLRLNVTQNCRATLQELQRIFGAGYIVHVKRRLQHSKQIYALVLDGASALAAIRYVAPYLRRKAAEAEVAVAFYEKGDLHRHPGPKGADPAIWAFRAWCYTRLKSLKKA